MYNNNERKTNEENISNHPYNLLINNRSSRRVSFLDQYTQNDEIEEENDTNNLINGFKFSNKKYFLIII